MTTLFDNYVAEERAEERAKSLKRGIQGIIETYHKFGQGSNLAREAAIEKYPEVAENLIDEIIDEVYGLVK